MFATEINQIIYYSFGPSGLIIKYIYLFLFTCLQQNSNLNGHTLTCWDDFDISDNENDLPDLPRKTVSDGSTPMNDFTEQIIGHRCFLSALFDSYLFFTLLFAEWLRCIYHRCRDMCRLKIRRENLLRGTISIWP